MKSLISGWLFPGPQTPPLFALAVGLLLSLCIDQVKWGPDDITIIVLFQGTKFALVVDLKMAIGSRDILVRKSHFMSQSVKIFLIFRPKHAVAYMSSCADANATSPCGLSYNHFYIHILLILSAGSCPVHGHSPCLGTHLLSGHHHCCCSVHHTSRWMVRW